MGQNTTSQSLGTALSRMMRGFRHALSSEYITSKEKEALARGIDGALVLQCYAGRRYMLPRLSDQVYFDAFEMISDAWHDIRLARKAYRKVREREATQRK